MVISNCLDIYVVHVTLSDFLKHKLWKETLMIFHHDMRIFLSPWYQPQTEMLSAGVSAGGARAGAGSDK